LRSGRRRDRLRCTRSFIASSASIERAGRQDVAERRAVSSAGARDATAVQPAAAVGAGRFAATGTADDPVDDVG
jgi:hypothetical protein